MEIALHLFALYFGVGKLRLFFLSLSSWRCHSPGLGDIWRGVWPWPALETNSKRHCCVRLPAGFQTHTSGGLFEQGFLCVGGRVSDTGPWGWQGQATVWTGFGQGLANCPTGLGPSPLPIHLVSCLRLLSAVCLSCQLSVSLVSCLSLLSAVCVCCQLSVSVVSCHCLLSAVCVCCQLSLSVVSCLCLFCQLSMSVVSCLCLLSAVCVCCQLSVSFVSCQCLLSAMSVVICLYLCCHLSVSCHLYLCCHLSVSLSSVCISVVICLYLCCHLSVYLLSSVCVLSSVSLLSSVCISVVSCLYLCCQLSVSVFLTSRDCPLSTFLLFCHPKDCCLVL